MMTTTATMNNNYCNPPHPSKTSLLSRGAEDIINDYELAQRKAEQAGSRRYEAAQWLQKMDQHASGTLPKEPTEEEFCIALRNGLILCNILNKVNPGAVSKVVENPVLTIQSSDGSGAQSAIQYFENTRNFLVAVGDMKLLTFEASDLEKGGSSSKVVDCILCLKGYHEWKQAGGIGVWRYGGTVKIISLHKETLSSLSREISDESLEGSIPLGDQQLLQHISHVASLEESKAADALTFLFERFGLGLLRAYLTVRNDNEEVPLNAMLIDTLLKNVVQDFYRLLVSQGNQFGLFLKESLKGGTDPVSKDEILDAISKYLGRRACGTSNDFSTSCICGRKGGEINISNNQHTSHVQRLDLQQESLEELRSAFQMIRVEVKQVESNSGEELKRLEHHIKGLEVASLSYHKLLVENRMLYNQVQDLKGNIRVYCRVRPFLQGERGQHSTVDYIGEDGTIMIVNPNKQGKDARRVFSFNKVFGTNITQQHVFSDTRPLIRSVLDGFNVCIFAYGQTGSGKTYTMSGPDSTTQETMGVNYQALSDLFQVSLDRTESTSYEISVQMIEIYNEQVRDLLSDGHKRLEIRNNSQLNGLNVPDASLVRVKCTQDVLDLMKIGQTNRAVGATTLNERSSRSHSVIAVHIQGKELVSGCILRGCLHLVDLAGSERVDKSEAVGDRLKEAQYINKSLSALGDVLSALAQKSTHIPYRNSKLTQVLQDSLGGQAKTLMFVHINPEVNSVGETISTLKFAERVASIELGNARSNKESGDIRDLKEEISNLKLALELKENEVEQLKIGSRIGPHIQKMRTVSPLRMPRCVNGSSLKHEPTQQSTHDIRSIEVRSSSSGKARRSRISSVIGHNEPISMMHFLPEEAITNSGKPRFTSPPVRRSLSSDRGAYIKSRLKLDKLDNVQTIQLQFPTRAAVNKSVASIPMISTIENKSMGKYGEHRQLENTSDAYCRSDTRKFQLDQENEQYKQVLNVKQGGIRKNKHENKAKVSYQLPARMHRTDVAATLLYEAEKGGKFEVSRKTDISEVEDENRLTDHRVAGGLGVKKLQQNFVRMSQNLEPRGLIPAMEPLLAGKHENKLLNNSMHYGKESSTLNMNNARRSRSSPRGKFTVLP